MAPFDAFYGIRCKYPIGWFEDTESSLLCPNKFYKTFDKIHLIRNHLQITYSQQKSYDDNRIKVFEFEESDMVYLKISPMKRLVRFGKKGKLSPPYVGPY